MSKSNPVRLWRFGRTGALIFTQKWPNRAKTGVPKNTTKNLWGPPWGVLVMQKIQLTQNNWKIKFIFYGLATRELYFLKKKDTKWPFPPSSGNWPICKSVCIHKTMKQVPFFHHYQGSIDFNTVNIHRTVGMYFLVSTGNRGDIEWHDLQRSYYPIHSLLPGVYVSILSLGTVFPRTLPMANIRNTSSRGKHWKCSSNDAE